MSPVLKASIKHHTNEIKRAAIELRTAGVSLSTIRTDLKLPETTLCYFLAHAKQNPENPVPLRKAGSGGQYLRNMVEIMARRLGRSF
jgi:hypothetical protein